MLVVERNPRQLELCGTNLVTVSSCSGVAIGDWWYRYYHFMPTTTLQVLIACSFVLFDPPLAAPCSTLLYNALRLHTLAS